MKRLCSLIIILFNLTLLPCTVSYAEVDPQQIIAGTTISETVLVDREGVKIIAKGISANSGRKPEVSLNFNVQNTRDEEIRILPYDCTVNLFQIFSYDLFTVPPKSNADYKLDMYAEDLEMSQIEHIMTISLAFDVTTADSETIFDTDEVVYVTSDYGQYVQQYNFPGTVIYDKNNIKITVLPQITEDYVGKNIILYVENNSEFDVALFGSDNITVNGKDVKGDLSAWVNIGKKSLEEYGISWESLAKNGIKDINSVNFSFNIQFRKETLKDRYGNYGEEYHENINIKF